MTTEGIPDHIAYTSLDIEGQAAVGRIALWAAWVEFSIAWLCNYLISDRYEKGAVVTRNMSAGGMLKLSRELVKASPQLKEDSTRILDLLTRVQSALDDRNEVLHGSVGGALDALNGDRLAAFHSRKNNQAVLLTNDQLDRKGKRLHELLDELVDAADLAYRANQSKS